LEENLTWSTRWIRSEEWRLLLELGWEFNKESKAHCEIMCEGPTGEDKKEAMEKNYEIVAQRPLSTVFSVY
jgi:hypothetical protein